MTFGRNDLHLTPTGLIVEVANTAEAVLEAQALRHQVYCRERGFLQANPSANLEQDRFDADARHVIVRRRSDREVVATARIVGGRGGSANSLPMQDYCCPSLFRGVRMEGVGEISRFAISKQARGTDSLFGPELRLLLLRGILQASQSMGLTHWYALMEPSLIRLLGATGVQFTALGPPVHCHGLRQPCMARVDHAVAHGRLTHPHFYEAVAARRLSRAA